MRTSWREGRAQIIADTGRQIKEAVTGDNLL